MSQTLVALNEKINKQIGEEKRSFITKSLVKDIGLSLLFATMSFSIYYKMGAVFVLPILCFLLLYNKRIAFQTIIAVSLFSVILDLRASLAVVASFLPLCVLIHKDNKKELNFFILVLVSYMSYTINTILVNTPVEVFPFIFITIYNGCLFTIFYKALEIKNHQNSKKDFLFKEEIVAILAILVNFSFCLLTVNISFLNIGFIFMLTSTMILGVLTSRVNIISYSVVLYFILQYNYFEVNNIPSSLIIPIIGVLVAFLPKNNFYIKTFVLLLLTPVLYYFNILNGDILNVMFSVSIATSIVYFVYAIFDAKYNDYLIPKYEESKYYRIYVESLREEISQRLLNFAELFNAFANKSLETNTQLVKIDEAIDEIIDKHCKGCLKKELCLNSNHIKTYNYFTQLLKEGEQVLSTDKKRFLDLFGMFCLNAFDIINTAIELNQEYMLSSEQKNSTNVIFQSQLHGLSKILQDFAIEVNTDYENETIKIEKLRDKMTKLGFSISYLKVNNSRCKNLDIDFGIKDYDENDSKLICNLVTEEFKEDVEVVVLKNKTGINKIKVISKRVYDLEFGTSYIGKDGSRITGDNFLKCDMHNGNTVIALSDGMGSGYSAHIESKSTLELLNKMINTGADDYTAVSIINTLVSLKEYNERFSTLDYVTINMSSGVIDFYKIGSAPSFIIRGNKVIRINNDNLPIGVSKEIDKISFDLELNDIIIIVSDGVVERFNNINKFEKILLQLVKTTSIQIAHDIIRAAITEFGGKIADDMTAIVLKVNSASMKKIA